MYFGCRFDVVFQVTVACFVPPVVIWLLHSPFISQYDLSSLRRVMCGAAPLSRGKELEFKQLLDAGDIRQGITKALNMGHRRGNEQLAILAD